MSTAVQQQQPHQDNHQSLDRASIGSSVNQGNTTQNPAGKEASSAQMIEKLYKQNMNLSREISLLSNQLPALLEKTTTTKSKSKKHLSNSNVVSSGTENAVQKELNETYKQINHLQKELKTLQAKYDNSANFERYREVENQIAIKDRELQRLITEKATLDRLVAEKEKAIDNIKKQTGIDTKVSMLGDELKDLKEKLKEAQAEEKKLEVESDKDNSQISKLKEELSKVKEAYRYMLEKTGYDPKEDKVRPKPIAKKSSSTKEKPKVEKSEKNAKDNDLDKLAFSPANFQKIYAQVKELRKGEAAKDKEYRKEADGLKERLDTLKKEGEEMSKKLAEKEKEANILTIKLRELHRIARYHSILPIEDEDSSKPALKVAVQSKVSAYMSPNSASSTKITSPSSLSFPTKPKLGRIDSLNEYAKNSFLYTGYRKDDRGKIAADGQGEHFSDRELMGGYRPKIVGLKVWHDNRRITGVQAVYKTATGLKEGTAHVKNPHAYKLESFEMGGDDYLKEISGFTNKAENNFECLMLMSAKGETKKILEPNRESKLFKFDINELEFPSIIYGYMKDETPRNIVTKFGILIASDNIEERIQSEKKEKREKVVEKREESPGKSR